MSNLAGNRPDTLAECQLMRSSVCFGVQQLVRGTATLGSARQPLQGVTKAALLTPAAIHVPCQDHALCLLHT